MTPPALELQVLIVQTLKADAAVMVLVNGVYDSIPTDPWGAKLAYVSLGPSDVIVDDADCIDGEIHSVQLDCWSRKPGMPECKRIAHAVKAALHNRDLELTDNAFVECQLENVRYLRDPDGETNHAAMQFSFTVEAL